MWLPKCTLPYTCTYALVVFRVFIAIRLQFKPCLIYIFQVVTKIEKLHDDLAVENVLMDKLAVKTEKVKVLSVHLSHADK